MITYLFGSTINEANRWLTVPIINQAFQPSDLAKLALISAVAGMLAKRQRKITDIKGTFIPIIIWIGIICLLIAMANMSTAVMLLPISLLLQEALLEKGREIVNKGIFFLTPIPISFLRSL